MPSETTRPVVTDSEKDKAIEQVLLELDHQLMKKGQGSFMSSHEIYGVIKEELDEVMDEIRKVGFRPTTSSVLGGPPISHDVFKERLKHELAQVAVAAIWGIASVDHCEWI